MPYRNLYIAHPARISCRSAQLLICTDCEHSVPLEDIAAVMVEDRQTSITAAALSMLAQSGISVYFCDEKHTPCGVLLPFLQHSRQTGMLSAQTALSLPAKKRLWQQIVTAKIRNQAECLSLCGKGDAAGWLYSRSNAVNSGDSENMEAVAAAYYFPALFGADFVRGNEADARNSALNYGYAILRGAIARALTAYGFLPSLGLHHCSELNAFNLADDLIEPFRPVVDLFVAGNVAAAAEMNPALKGQLFNLLNVDIALAGKHYNVAYAAELCAQNLQKCYREKAAVLSLPLLLELRQHTYE